MSARHPIGLVPTHPNRRAHPANGMSANVHVGDGAYVSITDPTHEDGIGWTLTWGDPESVRYTAASLLQSYDYLLSGDITMAEATRRLGLLRKARRELISGPDQSACEASDAAQGPVKVPGMPSKHSEEEVG